MWKNIFLVDWGQSCTFGAQCPHELSRPSNIIPLLLVGAAAYFIYRTARLSVVNSLSFVIKKIRTDLLADVPVIFLDLGVSNPTDHPLTVNSVKGKLLINDVLVGYVNQPTHVIIAGRQETLYTLPVEITVLSIIANLGQLLNKDAVIKFIGTVRVNEMDFPIEVIYNFFA